MILDPENDEILKALHVIQDHMRCSYCHATGRNLGIIAEPGYRLHCANCRAFLERITDGTPVVTESEVACP